MRRTVSLGIVVLAVFAGCSGTVVDLDCSRSRGGGASATVVESPPPNVTVVASDRLPENAPLTRELLRNAVTTNATTVELTPLESCQIRDELADVPRYDGERFGYYFDHNNTLVRVTVWYDT